MRLSLLIDREDSTLQRGRGHLVRSMRRRDFFGPLLDALLDHHAYLLFADYQSYVGCQDHVATAFLDQEKWSKMSIYNAVRMGRFSSDGAIDEYCGNIGALADSSRLRKTSDRSAICKVALLERWPY